MCRAGEHNSKVVHLIMGFYVEFLFAGVMLAFSSVVPWNSGRRSQGKLVSSHRFAICLHMTGFGKLFGKITDRRGL